MTEKYRELETLREHIYDLRTNTAIELVERLEELTDFERGRFQGLMHGYEEISDHIRGILKYGE